MFLVLKSVLRSFQRMSSTLSPPEAVRGMKILDKSAFVKQIRVPALLCAEADLHTTLAKVKKWLLKMNALKPIQSTGDGQKEILLLPSMPKEGFDLHTKEVELQYENWKAEECLKAILPEDQEQLTSFSRVGHILHLNLREHLMPYKAVIAEVLRDKTVGIRTVVNKTQSIDNTYRNFQLEILVGDPDFKVEVKECGRVFEFDFSTVYWNPRLAREHERIVEQLRPGDVLYDVFAGVGPFAIPAGKKGVRVLANDLNPESYRWLERNILRNKVQSRVKGFNKDGRAFILEDVAVDLTQLEPGTSVHITMNLPAMATTFLDVFVGLLKDAPAIEPVVHVYCFTPCEANTDEALKLVETGLGMKITALHGVNFVRSVAPNKDMMRVDFKLTREILQNCKRSVQVPTATVTTTDKKCKNDGKAFTEEVTAAASDGSGKTAEGLEGLQGAQ